MTPSHHRDSPPEVGTRFDVGADAVLADLSGPPRVAQVDPAMAVELAATYVDTADADLLAAGIVLRRRVGGDEPGWHLELPTDGDRYVLREPLGGSTEVPERLCRVLYGVLRGRPLVDVATLRTHRTVSPLRDDSGAIVAEVCDDGRRDLDADASTAEVLGEYVSRQVARLCRLDPLVRADLPDAVHQMRVACRRLRGVLASCRREFDPARTQPVRDDLAWLVDVLGRPRDLEVLRKRVRATTADPSPALDNLDAQLRLDHDRAHADAVRAMVSPRYLALVDTLRDLAADPPWSARATAPAEDELLAVLRAEWKRVRKAVHRVRHSSGTRRARRLHDVRRAAKRARYTAEALEPVFGDRTVSLVHALAALQDVLGSHHDAIVTLQVLRDLDRQRQGLDAVHQLRDRLRDDADRDDQTFQRLFHDLRKSPETRWLD